MDELLPKAMLSAIQVFLVMMGIFVLVIIVNVWMIIPIVIMAIIFYYVRFYFLSTAQDIKRLEGIGKYKYKLSFYLFLELKIYI